MWCVGWLSDGQRLLGALLPGAWNSGKNYIIYAIYRKIKQAVLLLCITNLRWYTDKRPKGTNLLMRQRS